MKLIFFLLSLMLTGCQFNTKGLEVRLWYENRVDTTCVETQTSQLFPEIEINKSTGATWTKLKFRIDSTPEEVQVGVLVLKGTLIDPEDSITLGYQYVPEQLSKVTTESQRSKIDEQLKKLTKNFDLLSDRIVQSCGGKLKKEIGRKCDGPCSE